MMVAIMIVTILSSDNNDDYNNNDNVNNSKDDDYSKETEKMARSQALGRGIHLELRMTLVQPF